MSASRPPALRSANPGDYGLPTKPAQDPATVAGALEQAMRSGCNILAPMTHLSHIPYGYAISLRVVTFDAAFTDEQRKKKSNGTFYITDDGALALHRTALDQLAGAAGISWDLAGCGRVDDGRNPFLWRYRMVASYRGFDGTTRQIIREHELDLSDGSPAAGKAAGGLRNARIYGAGLCQTKAANRVVRAALGLRAYTWDEAARPFVFPLLVWLPPTDNPEIDRMIAAKELGITAEVYGAPARAPTVIDVVPPGAELLLEDGGGESAPDYRHEERQLAARPKVQAGGRDEPPPPDEAPPWARDEERAPTPPRGWNGTKYAQADVFAYCRAKNWPEPANQAQADGLAKRLNGTGAADIDQWLARA